MKWRVKSTKKLVRLEIIEHQLIASSVTGCVSIFVFASLVCIPVVIASSAIGIKSFSINTGIQKYKSEKKEET